MLDGMETSKPCFRKRIRKEIGKFGRNIKWRILCAVFDKEMTHEDEDLDQMVSSRQNLALVQGFRKLAFNSFPSNHEGPKLEL